MKKLIALGTIAVVAAFVQASLYAAEHAAVGPEKCAKVCHKVQYESWSKSKHALAKEKTECETCHGNGADYMKLSVMKDPAKAAEAGLIAKPDKASCAKCHEAKSVKTEEITDAVVAKVHAHKVKK